jgi:hypothetical protein
MTSSTAKSDDRDPWQLTRSFLAPWARPLGSPRRAIEAAMGSSFPDLRQLFAHANLVALHLSRTGRAPEARGLMEAQSAAAARVPAALIWTLDSHLNRARLDVMSGDVPSGLARYSSLMRLCAWESDEIGLPFGRRELVSSANHRVDLIEATRALRNGVVGDLCRLHWRLSHMNELRSTAEDCRRRWPGAMGAGRNFPIEALLLLEPLALQEALPDGEPDDVAVRLLHLASHETWMNGKYAITMLGWASQAVDRHIESCPGCGSCVDWLIDLAATSGRRDAHDDQHLTRGARIAIRLEDYAGLQRLRSLCAGTPQEMVERKIRHVAPSSDLLTMATTGLLKQIQELQ